MTDDRLDKVDKATGRRRRESRRDGSAVSCISHPRSQEPVKKGGGIYDEWVATDPELIYPEFIILYEREAEALLDADACRQAGFSADSDFCKSAAEVRAARDRTVLSDRDWQAVIAQGLPGGRAPTTQQTDCIVKNQVWFGSALNSDYALELDHRQIYRVWGNRQIYKDFRPRGECLSATPKMVHIWSPATSVYVRIAKNKRAHLADPRTQPLALVKPARTLHLENLFQYQKWIVPTTAGATAHAAGGGSERAFFLARVLVNMNGQIETWWREALHYDESSPLDPVKGEPRRDQDICDIDWCREELDFLLTLDPHRPPEEGADPAEQDPRLALFPGGRDVSIPGTAQVWELPDFGRTTLKRYAVTWVIDVLGGKSKSSVWEAEEDVEIIPRGGLQFSGLQSVYLLQE